MPSIGTGAILIISTPENDPISFEFHADADNSDTINYSTNYPQVDGDTGELLAGQSITFANFVGSLWAKAEASGQNYSVTGVQHLRQTRGIPEEVVKA